MLSPRISDTRPPPFHEMEPVKFQEFSAELLGKEERFEDSQVYGRNGQAQFGIDVLAPLKQQGGIEVGQCKCWESTTAAKIREATDELLLHLDRWRAQKIRRFILFAACSTDGTKVQDQILIERHRLNELGIDYEVWDARKLRSKLRSHPDLVRVYCGEHFVPIICGPGHAVGGADAGLASGMRATVGQWGLAVADLAESRNSELEAIREFAAEGQTGSALGQLESLCAKPSWLQMPTEVQGKALRVKASLVLGARDDAASAHSLLLEAKRVHPEGDTTILEALLIHREQGAQAAASFLAQPKTLAEWNLRQRFLLELGRADEVLRNFLQIPAGMKPNEESAWSKTMALLLTRQVEQAREAIREALRLKPRYFDLRLAGAMVAYASAVSPLFGAWGHLTWPIPPPWNLVKRDSTARENLREAARTFRDLRSLAHGKGLLEIRIWELACLGNDPERQEEAEQMVKTLLHEVSSLVPAILWARERGYSCEMEPVLEAMQKRLAEPSLELDEVLACFSITADGGDLEMAEKVLDAKRQLFSTRKADYLWAFHKVQILAARGRSEEVRKIINEEPDETQRRALEAAALRSSCVMTKNFEPLARHLERSYLQSRDPTVLLDCCFAKRELNEWSFISEHAKELVHAFQTEPVLRLAAQGAFNANEPGLCVKLLEDNQRLCVNSKLPADLRHLAAECRRRCGQLPQAITEAEKLVQEGAGLPALAQLFQLQREKGDLQAMALTARKFRGMSEVPPQLLIQAIPLVKHQDPQLAQDLWRQMLSSAHNDPNVAAAAAMESFHLGVEDEAGALFPQMHALAQQPGSAVRALTIEDAVEFFRTASEEVNALLSRYEKGEIPVHFLVSHSRIPLARLFHENPTQSQAAPNPLSAAPVFIRHGSKAAGFLSPPPKRPQSIFVDVTSLLLARSIGLLDTVERHFETLFVSASLTQSLLDQLDLLSSQQPSLLKANQRLMALVRQGAVKTNSYTDVNEAGHVLSAIMGERWCARLHQAKQAGGVVVGHMPILSNCLPLRPVTLTEDLKPLVVSERQVVRAMITSGLISALEAESVLKAFAGPNDHRQAETSATGTADRLAADEASLAPSDALALRPGMPLFFEQSIAAGLAHSVALERLAGFCQVFIDQDEADALEAGIKVYEGNLCLKEWVTQLLAHVSRGIDSGKYRTHLHPVPKLPREPAHALSPEEHCLFDAVHFGETAEAFIWCDDRSIRAHDRVEKSQLGDTFDMLQLLRALGVLQDDAYFDYLFRLRAANARYLPLTEEEILHHLRAARIEGGVLQETPALRTLRRHTAACLLDRDRIQEPAPDGRGGFVLREMVVATAHQLSVLEALRSLWLEVKEPWDHVTARADWLWSNLCTDMRLVPQCFGNPTAVVEWRGLLADSIAHLLSLGLGLSHGPDKDLAGPSPRQAFFGWVETRAILTLLPNNPDLPQTIAGRLAQHLSHAERLLARAEQDHGENSREAIGIKVVVGLYIADLPPIVQSGLCLSAQTLLRWGLQSGGSVVETLNLKFPANAFWSAAARAVNQGHATLVHPQGMAKLRFTRGPTATTLRVTRKSKEPKATGVMNIEILPLLQSDTTVRSRLLSIHPEWFDLDPEARAAAIHRVVSEPDPAFRVALLGEFRESSMPSFYESLTKKLRDQKPLDISELLPQDKGLLRRYLRLQTAGDLGTEDQWPIAVQRLIEAEGVAQAISRVSCLPAPLPESIYAGLQHLDATARVGVIGSLASSLVGPLQTLHLIALCVAFSDDVSGILPLVEKRIELLCHPEHGNRHCKAFLAVLNWVNLRLGWCREAGSWPAHLRLRIAWVHSSGLYRSFCLAGSDPKAVEDWFAGNSIELSRDSLSTHWKMCSDAAAPPNVFPFGFVLRGMAYALAGAAEDSQLFVTARELLTRLASASAGSFSATYPLLRRLEFGANALESFLGRNDEGTMSRLIGAECYKTLFCPPEDAFQSAVNDLSRDPQSLAAWITIDTILGESPVPKDATARVEQAAKSVKMVSAFRQSKGDCILLAILVSKYAGKVGAQETRDGVLEQLVLLAREANATQSRTRDRLQDDEALLRLAAALPLIMGHLCAQEDPALAADALCRRISAILREWPAIASVGFNQLDHLIRQLPIGYQRAYWPMALTFRAVV